MPFDQEGAFRVFRDVNMPEALVLESSRLDDCLVAVRSRPFYGVVATKPNGFLESNCDCFRQIPHITLAWIWDIHLSDLSGLYTLPRLSYLRLTDDHGPVDFARLPALETLVLQHGQRDIGTESLNLCRSLYFWRFQPKSRKWSEFAFPRNLESLRVFWANPSDLDGWPTMPHLRTLEFGYCRNLNDLSRLPEIAPNLEQVLVDACGRVADLPIERLPKVIHAVVNRKRIRG